MKHMKYLLPVLLTVGGCAAPHTAYTTRTTFRAADDSAGKPLAGAEARRGRDGRAVTAGHATQGGRADGAGGQGSPAGVSGRPGVAVGGGVEAQGVPAPRPVGPVDGGVRGGGGYHLLVPVGLVSLPLLAVLWVAVRPRRTQGRVYRGWRSEPARPRGGATGRLLTLASAVSLVVSVAAAGLWVRSYSRWDEIDFLRLDDLGPGIEPLVATARIVSTGRGRVTYASLSFGDPPDGAGRASRSELYWESGAPPSDPDPARLPLPQGATARWRVLGLDAILTPAAGGGPPSIVYLSVPLRLVTLLTAVPPGLRLAGWWRRAGRTRPGLCPACSYDLTGDESGRCPECGRPITKGAP